MNDILIFFKIVTLLFKPLIAVKERGVNPCGVMVNGLDYNVVVSEFKLQFYYYIHFQTNALRKDLNSSIHPTPPVMN